MGNWFLVSPDDRRPTWTETSRRRLVQLFLFIFPNLAFLSSSVVHSIAFSPRTNTQHFIRSGPTRRQKGSSSSPPRDDS
ncbi:hypothetical protein XA68_18127 [Ophiocordyceps unilateralis]|uniref:Transmembrane protein n=1 Tax=Ophiocordyceps unilateralis TaxID=268505 RepID=A0A2A9P3R4_OPHUN|nr:hypothetical protein XA68_18127 [Ophiocordyceps unilateralis]